jgi:hypothetical protein
VDSVDDDLLIVGVARSPRRCDKLPDGDDLQKLGDAVPLEEVAVCIQGFKDSYLFALIEEGLELSVGTFDRSAAQ